MGNNLSLGSDKKGAGMDELEKELKHFIKSKVTQALTQSETYIDAIRLVECSSGWTEYDQAIKKAIQAEIKNQALNSEINYNALIRK